MSTDPGPTSTYMDPQNSQLLTLDLPQLWEHQSSAGMSHSHLAYKGTSGILKPLKSQSLLIRLRFQPHLCVGQQQALMCSQSPARCEHSVGLLCWGPTSPFRCSLTRGLL